jgi:DNA-binding NarL/FixJ family response regulator
MIRVVIVDDQKVFRDGLKLHLNKKQGIHIVGEISDGRSSINKIIEKKPNIVILDIQFNNNTGLDFACKILKKDPSYKIIILSNVIDKFCLLKAIKYGIKAYILKKSDEDEILKCIRKVDEGGLYYSNEVMNGFEQTIIDKVDDKKYALLRRLTAKELEVLSLLSGGKIIKEIAGELHTSPRTIDRTLSIIKNKLNIIKKTDLIKYYTDRMI